MPGASRTSALGLWRALLGRHDGQKVDRPKGFKLDDLDTAKAWYNSPGYQAVVGLRLAGSDGVGRFAESFNGGR